MNEQRRPSGASDGGQWTPPVHPESAVTLDDPIDAPEDAGKLISDATAESVREAQEDLAAANARYLDALERQINVEAALLAPDAKYILTDTEGQPSSFVDEGGNTTGPSIIDEQGTRLRQAWRDRDNAMGAWHPPTRADIDSDRVRRTPSRHLIRA